MSLDVYLSRKIYLSYDEGKTYTEQDEELYWANITHNLGTMANKAGIYEALWTPFRIKDGYKIPEWNNDDEHEFENSQIIKAANIVPVIETGLANLKSRPEYFKKFNSENGWGLYEHFVPFVEKYLQACKEYPEAIVRVSR